MAAFVQFPRGDLGEAEVATIRFIAGHYRSKVTPVTLFLEDGEPAVNVRDLGVARLETLYQTVLARAS